MRICSGWEVSTGTLQNLWGRGGSRYGWKMCQRVRRAGGVTRRRGRLHAAAKVGGKQRHRQHSTSSTLSRGWQQSLHLTQNNICHCLREVAAAAAPSASHRFCTSRTHTDYAGCDDFDRHKTDSGRSPCGLIAGLRYMPCIVCISLGWIFFFFCPCNRSYIYWQPRRPTGISLKKKKKKKEVKTEMAASALRSLACEIWKCLKKGGREPGWAG